MLILCYEVCKVFHSRKNYYILNHFPSWSRDFVFSLASFGICISALYWVGEEGNSGERMYVHTFCRQWRKEMERKRENCTNRETNAAGRGSLQSVPISQAVRFMMDHPCWRAQLANPRSGPKPFKRANKQQNEIQLSGRYRNFSQKKRLGNMFDFPYGKVEVCKKKLNKMLQNNRV